MLFVNLSLKKQQPQNAACLFLCLFSNFRPFYSK